MHREVDPELNELRALKAAADWTERAVLEIGCGDGRLARRMVALGASVAAIDWELATIRPAMGEGAESPGRRVRYAVAYGQQLPFPSGSFDIVVFGWSL